MKPRGERRFTWWRAYHGMPTHPKWRIVARKSGCSISSVFHIAIILMDVASRGRPRGSIAEFSHVDCAGAVDLDEVDVLRVLDALEDIHWVEGHMISTWDERQPERDGKTDATAADRQRRFRERIRGNPAYEIDAREWSEIREQVFERDGYQCVYCGSRENLRCDHKVPRSKGGSTSVENLATACAPCNGSKGDKTVDEWVNRPARCHAMSRLSHRDNAMSRPPDLEKKDILPSTELVEGQKEARQESKPSKIPVSDALKANVKYRGWVDG